MIIPNLPQTYQPIWNQCIPLFAHGRPGDMEHTMSTVFFLLQYQGKTVFDSDILVPAAMLHDVGHAAILPQHIKYLTGQHKILNGKLVHMLTGAKIAHDILTNIQYPQRKLEEIVEIISIHDFDQLQDDSIDLSQIYDTLHKRIFHDIDMLDRYTSDRIQSMRSLYPASNTIYHILQTGLRNFFIDEFRLLAQNRLSTLTDSLQ